MIELAWIGMALIIVSWIIQIFSLYKGKKELTLSFVGLQVLGIFFLVLSDFVANGMLSTGGMLEMLPFLGAIVSLVLLIKRK